MGKIPGHGGNAFSIWTDPDRRVDVTASKKRGGCDHCGAKLRDAMNYLSCPGCGAPIEAET